MGLRMAWPRVEKMLLVIALCSLICLHLVNAQGHHSMPNMTMDANSTAMGNTHGSTIHAVPPATNGTMHHNNVNSNSTSGGTMHHGGMGTNSTTGSTMHHGNMGTNSTSGGTMHHGGMKTNGTSSGGTHHGTMAPGDTSGSMDHGGSHGGTEDTLNTGGGHSNGHGTGHNMEPGTTVSDGTAGGGHSGGHGAGHGSGGASTAGHYGFFHMTFNTVILFEQWVTSTWQGLLGSCMGILVATVLYEGLKVFRSYLLKKLRNTTNIKPSIAQKMCSCSHVVQTLLHVVQMVLSYLLMLVFMTFNLWLCLAVAVGFGLGYFIFRWDQGYESVDSNDHCM